MDLISIIVPVYNIEEYLERCIESLLAQTYSNIEIILVNDGSDDLSGLLCDEYSKKYSNVSVIHKENGGLGYARNSGLEKANGKFVKFVDGDDYLAKDRIDNMYKEINKTGSDTCLAGHSRVYSKSIVEKKNQCSGLIFSQGNIRKEILPRMCGKINNLTDYIEMSVCMVLFSNDIIKRNKLKFNSEREFINEDLIFDMNYYPFCNKVCVCDDVGYYYCDNRGSLTTKYRANRFELQKVMYSELEIITSKLGIYELCEQRMMTTFISVARYCIKLEEKFSLQNGNSKAKQNIAKICNDELLNEVWKKYDNRTVPVKSRMINILIMKKRSSVLFYIMRLKNSFGI